jgi:hypothetical protein
MYHTRMRAHYSSQENFTPLESTTWKILHDCPGRIYTIWASKQFGGQTLTAAFSTTCEFGQRVALANAPPSAACDFRDGYAGDSGFLDEPPQADRQCLVADPACGHKLIPDDNRTLSPVGFFDNSQSLLH